MQVPWQDPPQSGGGSQFAMPVLTSVVKALILLNAGVFVALFLLSFGSADWAVALTRGLGISPRLWADWFPLLPVWQLLTWGFLHSLDSPFHILFNMMFLYFLGTMLEGIVGPRRFLVTYVSALLVAGLATLLVGFASAPEATTIGASGAVMCVVVAMAVMRPNTRIIFLIFPITLKTFAIIYVGIDVFFMLMSLKGATSNVAHLAHLAGAGWGYLIVKAGWIWRDPVRSWELKKERSAIDREHEDEGRLDELLAKINKEGIHSLSTRERAFLKRVSKRR